MMQTRIRPEAATSCQSQLARVFALVLVGRRAERQAPDLRVVGRGRTRLTATITIAETIVISTLKY